jgi:hypothetical protein
VNRVAAPADPADATRRTPVPGDPAAPPAQGRPAGPGEEIWIVEMRGGPPRRKVGAADLARHTGGAESYSLHDLSWSPDGSRLAFTWYDGSGWARLLVAEADGSLTPLPAPERADPWDGGSYLLSGAQFVWDPAGTSGVMVAWDDECGHLYGVAVPAAPGPGPLRAPPPREEVPIGDSGPPPGRPDAGLPLEIPLPGGCRVAVVESDGYWLSRSRESDLRQRLAIADRSGSVIATHIFDAGAPVFARWGHGRGSTPPPVLGWRLDRDREEIEFFAWTGGEPVVWGRGGCRPDCPEPLLVTREGIWLLERPESAGRLLLVRSPGAEPLEVIPSGAASLRADPGGTTLVVALRETAGGRLSLWRLDERP